MHKVGFKPSIMTYTASTSSRRAGGSLTPAPPGGLRRGCADTSGATPLRQAEVSGPTPPTSLRVPGADRWRSHGRRGYTKPTGRPTPRRPPPRGRETRRPGGTLPAPQSASPDLQVLYRGRPVSLCLWWPWRTAKRGEVVTVHHAQWHLPHHG